MTFLNKSDFTYKTRLFTEIIYLYINIELVLLHNFKK